MSSPTIDFSKYESAAPAPQIDFSKYEGTSPPRTFGQELANEVGYLIVGQARNLGAYDLYLRGRVQLYKLSAEGFKQAKQYLEGALERDPEFALACDALAELYWYLGFFGYLPPRETCSRGLFLHREGARN